MDAPSTTTSTIELMVIVPNADAVELAVPVGTTIADLARQLDIPDAERISALDEMSNSWGPNVRLGVDATPTAVSYCYKLAGA